MEIRTVKCDQCGIEKRETNHWWKASGLVSVTFAAAPVSQTNGIYLPADLCGQGCVHKWMDRWITEQSKPYNHDPAFDIETATFTESVNA